MDLITTRSERRRVTDLSIHYSIVRRGVPFQKSTMKIQWAKILIHLKMVKRLIAIPQTAFVKRVFYPLHLRRLKLFPENILKYLNLLFSCISMPGVFDFALVY